MLALSDPAFVDGTYMYRDVATNLLCGKAWGSGITNNALTSLDTHDPDAQAFFKRVAHATAGYGLDYVVFGRMLRPAELQCEQTTFNYPDGTGRVKWNEPQVLHSVWEAPNGTIGYLLINFTEDDALDFTFPLAPRGYVGNQANLSIIVNGERRPTRSRVSLPTDLTLSLEGRSIMLVETAAASCASFTCPEWSAGEASKPKGPSGLHPRPTSGRQSTSSDGAP